MFVHNDCLATVTVSASVFAASIIRKSGLLTPAALSGKG
jgi:hypothetical protein